MRWKTNIFLNFLAFFLKDIEVVTLVFLSNAYSVHAIFNGSKHLWDSCFWWSTFFLNYQNVYGHWTFYGGDIPQGLLPTKFEWQLNVLILWINVTNKIHVFTLRRPIGTILGKALTHYWRISPLKSHDTLISWPIWGYMAIWKVYISAFTRVNGH